MNEKLLNKVEEEVEKAYQNSLKKHANFKPKGYSGGILTNIKQWLGQNKDIEWDYHELKRKIKKQILKYCKQEELVKIKTKKEESIKESKQEPEAQPKAKEPSIETKAPQESKQQTTQEESKQEEKENKESPQKEEESQQDIPKKAKQTQKQPEAKEKIKDKVEENTYSKVQAIRKEVEAFLEKEYNLIETRTTIALENFFQYLDSFERHFLKHQVQDENTYSKLIFYFDKIKNLTETEPDGKLRKICRKLINVFEDFKIEFEKGEIE